MLSFDSKSLSLISRLGGFFTWWMEQLSELVPEFIRRFFQADAYQLRLDFAHGKVSITDLQHAQQLEEASLDIQADSLSTQLSAALSRINATNLETLLILDASDALFLDVNLPAEAEPDLENILSYEMDRRTPFSIDQVYYDYKVQKVPGDVAHILVKLVVVPRELVGRSLEKVDQWGLKPGIISVAGNDINLLPPALRSSRPQFLAKFNSLLIVTVILLLLLSAYLAMNRQDAFIEQLKQETALLNDEVREVQRLRKQIENLGKESSRIVETKQQSPHAVRILNDLSLLLPQHTWLQRFELNGSQINLQGESSNAS